MRALEILINSATLFNFFIS